MSSKIFSRIALLIACALLGACANGANPSAWRGDQAMTTGRAVPGVVVDARPVRLEAVDQNGVNRLGAGLGALAGGLAGSQVGGGYGKLLVSGLGAIVGGLAGNEAGARIGASSAIEYVIQTGNSAVYVVQGPQQPLSVGQAVWVIGPRGSERASPRLG